MLHATSDARQRHNPDTSFFSRQNFLWKKGTPSRNPQGRAGYVSRSSDATGVPPDPTEAEPGQESLGPPPMYGRAYMPCTVLRTLDISLVRMMVVRYCARTNP